MSGAALALLVGCTGSADQSVEVEAADEVVIVCGERAPRVEPSVAQPRSDGVHLRIENPSTVEWMLVIEAGGGAMVPPGELAVVREIRPGSTRVGCVGPSEPEEPELGEDGEGTYYPYPTEDDWAALEIIDPDGLWVDATLACDSPIAFHLDYEWDMGEGPMRPGEQRHPVELARRDLPHQVPIVGEILPGDRVEPAGYRGISGNVRLVRRGVTIAVISYRSDGQGGWHLGGASYCEE